jgi:hypothetical protein
MTMQGTINRNLLQYAVGHRITCPRCSRILDMRDAVTATLSKPAGGSRDYTLCCACWDQVRLAMHDIALELKASLEVIDGREVFPPTLAQAKRILAAVGCTITHKRDTGEYRVNLRGGTEETAYYGDSINDAIATGKDMARRAKGVK